MATTDEPLMCFECGEEMQLTCFSCRVSLRREGRAEALREAAEWCNKQIAASFDRLHDGENFAYEDARDHFRKLAESEEP